MLFPEYSNFNVKTVLNPTLATNGGSIQPSATSTWLTKLSYASPIMSTIGMLQSGLGSYFSSSSQKSSAEYQAQMGQINANISDINAKMAENSAQTTLMAGNRAVAASSLKTGKVVASQVANQGARGVVAGIGSAAEETTSAKIMGKWDEMNISANAVRDAWNQRMQGLSYQSQAVNQRNSALLANASASSINPFLSATSSLLTSGASVARQWYDVLK